MKLKLHTWELQACEEEVAHLRSKICTLVELKLHMLSGAARSTKHYNVCTHALSHTHTHTADYGWLHAREAGQASTANGVKVSAWQALCLLAPFIPEAMHAKVVYRFCSFFTPLQVWPKPYICTVYYHVTNNILPYNRAYGNFPPKSTINKRTTFTVSICVHVRF